MGKLQHYVPRFYLRAWTNDEKIYCLQDGQVRHQNIKGVGAENYFYRLHELTPEDVRFLKEFINDSPDGLRESHERLLNHFLFPHLAKHQLETAGRANAGLLEEINRAIVEMNERMHTSIEEDFKPQLDALISGDLRFLADPAEAAQFYWGLAIQYSRTHHIKKNAPHCET